jgi:hypothetical protein
LLPAQEAVEDATQVTEHNLVVMVEELLERVELRVVLVMAILLMVVAAPNLQEVPADQMVERLVRELPEMVEMELAITSAMDQAVEVVATLEAVALV